MEISEKLAEIALEIKAIKLQPDEPFTWASGYRMPIYNDNRMLLGDFEHRALIADGFQNLIKENNLNIEVVAGTATAGIPAAASLADKLKTPLIYVRKSEKDHGMQNRIEGVLHKGQNVLLIEDLISTGGSSISALEAIREAGGRVETCMSIFSYGFEKAKEGFEKVNSNYLSLLSFAGLLEVAIKKEYINSEQQALLEDWRKDPFGWGQKHGFPKE